MYRDCVLFIITDKETCSYWHPYLVLMKIQSDHKVSAQWDYIYRRKLSKCPLSSLLGNAGYTQNKHWILRSYRCHMWLSKHSMPIATQNTDHEIAIL